MASNKRYEVKQGDTLFQIAANHNVSLEDLLKANPGITNPDFIAPKQIINIP